MTNVRLTKAMFNGATRGHLSASWVSNGHWALKRECVVNSGILTSCDTLRDALGLSDVTALDSESFVPVGLRAETDTWHTTRFLFESGHTLIRILTRAGKGELAGINNAYLKMLVAGDEFQTLFASSANSPFVMGDDPSTPTVVLMPFDCGVLESQVRALVLNAAIKEETR